MISSFIWIRTFFTYIHRSFLVSPLIRVVLVKTVFLNRFSNGQKQYWLLMNSRIGVVKNPISKHSYLMFTSTFSKILNKLQFILLRIYKLYQLQVGTIRLTKRTLFEMRVEKRKNPRDANK